MAKSRLWRLIEADAKTNADLRDRAAATAETMRRNAEARGFFITADDRIGENDLAELMGWAGKSLGNMRRRGEAPRHFEIAARGHRVTYRITDVALWLEARMSDAA